MIINRTYGGNASGHILGIIFGITAFLLILLPGCAFALSGWEYSAGDLTPTCPAGMSGDGTLSNPCMIINCAQLQAMNQSLSLSYALNNDVDCSATSGWNGGAGFEPVGSQPTPFTGHLDGNRKNITNLYIYRTSTGNVGLFGYVNGGSISNLGITGASSLIYGHDTVGSLAGYLKGSTVTNCYSTVSLDVGDGWNGNSGWYIGGLVGYAENSQIEQCYTTGSITAGNQPGGIVGQMINTTIKNCYTTGNILSRRDNAGGIVAITEGTSAITNCYTLGNVSTWYSNAAGVAAYVGDTGMVKNCYATGTMSGDSNNCGNGGLLACYNPSATVTNSYFTDASHNNGIGTLETRGASTFYNSSHAVYHGSPAWDFNKVWKANQAVSYPTLRMAGDITPPGINFMNPTPANNTNTTNTSAIINVSITNAADLNEFKWNWNGTNYTIYDDSLIFMMNFDNVSALGENNTHVVDVSKQGNNGTTGSGAIWNSTGKYGGGYDFNGAISSGYINFGVMDSQLVGLNSITTSAWIYPKRFGTDNSYREVIISNTVDDNVILEWRLGGNGFIWGIFTTGNGAGGQFGTGLLNLNQWQYVAVVWNGTVVSAYLNGQKLNETYSGGGTVTRGYHFCDPCTPIPLFVGSRGPGERHAGWYPNSFLGSIDEVRIYNRSLSADEIKQLYYSNLNNYASDKWAFYTNESNLSVGAYTYSASAKDASGNANSTEDRTLNVQETPTPTLTGSISGSKINDTNGNGKWDAGELGLANWTITLTNESGGVVTNVTDASGNYSFTNLTEGNYTVGEVIQPGWIQTAPAVSTTGSATYNVQISGGNDVPSEDFGNFQLGSVSGTKFEDLNANGVRDTGEAGLAGWQITITGKDTIENVQVTETTTTDANGNYNFTGLSAGTYTISETQKDGWVQTAPPGGTFTVTITSGANITGQDFGNFHKGNITGGGLINITGDPKATFGIVGQYPDALNTAKGRVEYKDHNASLNVKSIQINTVATTLDKKKGAITGLATVNGAGSYPFVVYVEDNGEPGKGADVFKISLPTYPYSNGAILSGGNIQIHS